MPVIDIIIIAVIVLSAMVSFVRGFFRETMSFIGWAVAIVAAYHFATDVMPYFEGIKILADYTVRYIASALTVFLVGLLFMGVVNYLVGSFIMSVGVSGTDRILGVGFGVVRGVLIVGLIFWLVHPQVFNWDLEKERKESQLIGHFDPVVEWLLVNLESVAEDWSDKASGGSGGAESQPANEPETAPSI